VVAGADALHAVPAVGRPSCRRVSCAAGGPSSKHLRGTCRPSRCLELELTVDRSALRQRQPPWWPTVLVHWYEAHLAGRSERAGELRVRPSLPQRTPAGVIQAHARGLQNGCSLRCREDGVSRSSLQMTAGRTWIRTRDLFLIRIVSSGVETLSSSPNAPTRTRRARNVAGRDVDDEVDIVTRALTLEARSQ